MDRSPCAPPTAAIEWEIAALFEREAGGILRYARGLGMDEGAADDALQEAFFRLFLCRSAGQEIRSPRAWLFRVVHNYALDQQRAGFRNNIALEALAQVASPPQSPEPGLRVSDLMSELPQIGLSAREMECVRLRTEDLSYEEIADVLGLQVGTIGALLTRAHGKVRKAMARRDQPSRGSAPALAEEKYYAS
jgi:RNA polymerase sigma-70 factor (ECF subfamily)